MPPLKIKLIAKGVGPAEEMQDGPWTWGDYEFWSCSDIRDYDWLVVYDEFPTNSTGSIIRQSEPLACHPDHTLLVTVEPPSIKIYPQPYTSQFGAVLTTHSNSLMRHKDHIRSGGALLWFYGKPMEEILKQEDMPKTKIISTVCSTKQQKHTLHAARYHFTKYIADHIPELDWYGRGVKPMKMKYEALDDYKYHIAIENYLGPHHWTEKLSDMFLGLCLPFYVGDRSVLEYFPEDSIIFLPLDNPAEAVRIIRRAIDNNEYEKRLPALKEARRRVIEEYNFFALAAKAISERHSEKPPLEDVVIKGRHALRRNPWNALVAGWQFLRYRYGSKPKD